MAAFKMIAFLSGMAAGQQDPRCPFDRADIFDVPCGSDEFFCIYNPLNCDGDIVYTSRASCRRGNWLISSTAIVCPVEAIFPRQLSMTHYWDCNGQGCDAATLAPFVASRYVSPSAYAPMDPNDFGGSVYGESLWLTGAASDALSLLLGDDDPCCGSDLNDGGVGGCGKCVLIQNPDSLRPEWTAVAMKKNRCPPNSNLCGGGKGHFDVAAPGFDNLNFSTANVCGQFPLTGMSREQSGALGNWFTQCSNTQQCANLCDTLPLQFRSGCRLFASWEWTRGDPRRATFLPVPCPAELIRLVGQAFGPSGPM